MGSSPSIAVVGCGAATSKYYVPAINDRFDGKGDLIFADVDEERAKTVAEQVGRGRTVTDYTTICDEVDGAIIVVPPPLHYNIAVDFLQAGTHVLVEKPLTETSREATQLVEIASQNGAQIAVDNTRRLFPSIQAVKRAIQTERVGRLEAINIAEGAVFDWQSASQFRFTNSTKGVLMDIGAHVLDILCYWLGERPTLQSYQDDSYGGTEAVSALTFETAGNVEGSVRLSWLTRLSNVYEIQGSEGTISVEPYGWNTLTITRNGKQKNVRLSGTQHTFEGFVADVFENFVEVVSGTAEPLVPGSAVVDSISLIEECYERRERFSMPWMEPKL